MHFAVKSNCDLGFKSIKHTYDIQRPEIKSIFHGFPR